MAAVFAEPEHFGGTTFAVASDAVTGQDIAAVFSEVAGRQISYSRFHHDVLADNSFLAKLTELLDTGVLAGTANPEELRNINPQLKTFRSWLAGSGRSAFIEALGTSGEWGYGHD